MTANSTEHVLSVQNLKKKIRSKWIIKGISFDVGPGEVFGFLGPNGAGKTTTIRMLVRLIRPTEGSIKIGGIPMDKHPNEALKQVGCIVENPELYGYLSGWENLEHFARMLPGVGSERIREVVAIVGMEKRIHDKVKTYSLGMRQRLGIAQALLGNPKLLILDEPTNGLDPQGIKEMRQFIRRLAETGLSVFVSSHLLSEIQLMCDRVAIISQGTVIAVGEVEELLRQADDTIVWRVDRPDEAERMLQELGLAPVRLAEEEGTEAEERPEEDLPAPDRPGEGRNAGCALSVPMEEARVPEVNRKLAEAGIGIFSIQKKNPTLEDLFLRLTEGERIG
ncbi:ABC transporter ATP-binding protein [Paenibacillus sp. J31TS4]|uniref:ABC transporter ATP-binding protein n=1 Tax=Paenibacillus sp. J31TS4 TaxID=2807195 RepID=UPI0020BE813D|nr:ABC transporter ATP-binding protein [Paenibacillus sp. J31TS4]